MREDFAALVRRRLESERGRIAKQAGYAIALAYPSPYRVAMSSLGLLQIYRLIQGEPGMACERVFLPDEAPSGALSAAPRSYEGLRPLGDFPVVAFSVAYELEIAGLVQLLEAAAIPALASQRGPEHPIVVAGGPLTFSNPRPLAPFVDAVVMGEADSLVLDVLRTLRDSSRSEAHAALARLPHVFVPSVHADLPPIARCDDDLLPAWSPIQTPDTELSDMFLIEPERGCSRGCSYCVMRRSTNGGMRLVPPERVLAIVPESARRVGLVGAAVSDHPGIVTIVRALVERGSEVGLSSLRPDRLSDEFVAALRAAGYRTLTTAMDGASDRVRGILDRRTREQHLLRSAELARLHGMSRLKLYLMLGVPGEGDADVDECARLTCELSRLVPVSLAVAPFCAKRNTPLDGQPFAGIDVVSRRLDHLRRRLRGRAEVRATSARWAWIEHALAQGAESEGLALQSAVHAGGRFADYRRAFESRAAPTQRKRLFIVHDQPRAGERRHARWLEPAAEGT
jgi:radical SAM superfamily enzyme YgiQ (UPF0313 family)